MPILKKNSTFAVDFYTKPLCFNTHGMKTTRFFAFLMGLTLAASFASCNDNKEEKAENNDEMNITDENGNVPMKEINVNEDKFHKTYLVADINDAAAIYKKDIKKENSLFVISKKEYRLYVYETGADTTLAATFPVCYAINPEAKEREGDNRTPECSLKNPFRIKEVVNASDWNFDFNDGRGQILAFGHWFIRLDLSQSFPDNPALAANRSIGIHGSTGNRLSIPGRDSHGCIRLYDEDLETLHDNYLAPSTTVVIKGINEDKLPFEKKAIEALGNNYKPATPGNPNVKKDTADNKEQK